MSNLKWVVVAVLAALAAALLSLHWLFKGVPVQTAAVETGKISEYVDERAKTSLPHVYHVFMPVAGRIKPIALKPGAPVKKDDVIAEVDTSDLQTAAAEAAARLEAIKSQIEINNFNEMEKTALDEAMQWIASFDEMLKASQKKIDASKLLSDYAEEYQKSVEASGGAVSRIAQSEARMKSAVEKVNFESSEINHSAMKIARSISNLYPVYIRQYLKRKGLEENVLKNQLEETKAALDKTNRDLARAAVKSPSDGTVLKVHVSNERFLNPGEALLDIGNLDEIEVTADVLSEDAVKISVGDPADISLPSLREAPVRGSVRKIEPEGFVKTSSLGVEQLRVPVKISFNKEDLAGLMKDGGVLGDGFRVNVRIYTASADNALKVPRPALFRGSGGKWKIFAVKGGKAVLTDVEVGLSNDTDAQILKGLAQGDMVVVAPPTSISSGTRVSWE